MKIYKVNLTLYVLAEDIIAAKQLAAENVNDRHIELASRVYEFKDVLVEWRDEIPFGETGDRTIRQIMGGD